MRTAIAATAIIAALGIAGTGDYQEAVRSHQKYCNMVAQGAWPDFKPETQCDTESGK